MQKENIPERNEVPKEETWNLESIFESTDAWEKAIETVKLLIPGLSIFQGTLAENPITLKTFLNKRETALRLVEKIYEYGGLPSAVNTADQDAIGRAGQARAIYTQLITAVSFLDPELLSIGSEKLLQWCESDPDLAVYRFYFEKLERSQEHIRSAEVEEILAMASEPLSLFSETHNSLTSADLEFSNAISSENNEIEVGQSNIDALITDPDESVRKTAWQNYADGYLRMKNTLAGTQTGSIQSDVFNARAHGFENTLSASLFPNNIPEVVFHNVIDVYKDYLEIWHHYWKVRARIFGSEQFSVWDIKSPLAKNAPKIPFLQAVDWICEGMAPLGDEYVNLLRNGCLKERWVDRAVNKGKSNGAFSAGAYDTQPFIMMSYNDDVFSLSTLAHELGHSMHTLYSNKSQPYVYGNYSLFVAEVASNFNPAMVRDYLFKTQLGHPFQMALIEETMSNFHRYFFIMPILAQWEYAMHQRVEQGKPINADIMNKTCAELFSEGYGGHVAFNEDQVGITWAQFPHMYANYYVYQYTTGIAGAHALISNVATNKGDAVKNYLSFLSAGSSIYPLNALKMAGVDLTSPEPVEKAFYFLAKVIDRLDNIIK